MKNLPILILVALFVILCFLAPRSESFSDSGLAISNDYCRQLTDVYYRPGVNDPKCRKNYRKRICGKQRRSSIDPWTGNYFTYYGQLL